MLKMWIIASCLLWSSVAAGAPERLAVLELKGAAALSDEARAYLTDVVRGVSLRLPRARWFVLTRENILQSLPPDVDLSTCEGACEVETGRNIGAHVVISGEILEFGGLVRVTLKAHETGEGRLLASARASAKGVGHMEGPLEQAALRVLRALPGAGEMAPAASAGPLDARLAELTRLQAARRAAEAAEAALRAEALKAHAADVETRWRAVAPLGRAGGPEGRQAVELFLEQYAEHPLGNPRAMEARAMLARMAGGRGVEEPGKAGVVWVTLPGGSFSMGHADGDLDERPVRTVTLPPFQLTKAEITVGQYALCAEAGACPVPGADPDDPHPLPEGCAFERGGQPDLPMDCVTLAEARAFAAWIGGRLPSEAEWEYAARGAGGEAPARGTLDPRRGVVGVAEPAPVCTAPEGRTRQGLCDMMGNVWEWVDGDYFPNYQGAPTDGAPWHTPPGAADASGGADVAIRFSYTSMPRLGRPRYVLEPISVLGMPSSFDQRVRALFRLMVLDKPGTYGRTRLGFKADAAKTGAVYVYIDARKSRLSPIIMAEIFHTFVEAGARRVYFPGVEQGGWAAGEARLPYPIYVPRWTSALLQWRRRRGGASWPYADNMLGVSRGGAFDTSEAAWLRPTYRNAEGPRDRIEGVGFRVAR